MIRPLVAVALAVGILLLSGSVQAQLVVYDEFTTPKIDPTKWLGSETSHGSPNTETSRKIAAKKLKLLLTSFGLTSSDAGTAGNQNQIMAFANPVPITTIQASVTINSPLVQGCLSNSTPTRARAQVIGSFFNDGTSSGPGDRTGDIGAGIQKVRDSFTGNVIEAFLVRCTNADCTSVTTVASHTFVASWVVGNPDTLHLQWDAPGHRFVYWVSPGSIKSKPSNEETVEIPYAFSDSTPAAVPGRSLRAHNTVASCTAGQKKASLVAVFDNVFVNP